MSSASSKMVTTMNKNADQKQLELHKYFPADSVFSNQKSVLNFIAWVTFFRRNLHRFVRDYLGIKLYLYQSLMIYLFGISDKICVIASRACAKSFIVALWACSRCILYPGSKVVLASATRGQSKLIVSEKIDRELCTMSPALKKEILTIKDNQNEIVVTFKNGSSIFVVTASDSARGVRSTAIIRDEYRLLNPDIDSAVLSPFQIIRQPPFMKDPFYMGIEVLKEEPIDLYISSSWFDNSWIWRQIADNIYKDMLNGGLSCMLCFDEYVSLKHGIKSQKFFQSERKKQDPITFSLEILNVRVKENTSAFFPYGLLQKNQVCKQPFYPRTNEDFITGKKNAYQIPKQPGEIRLLSCDMAFVANEKGKNDNSVFSCLRLLPETKVIKSGSSEELEISNGYHVSLHYMMPIQGGDTDMQSLQIRRLYESWQADYLVLDLRNAGSDAA